MDLIKFRRVASDFFLDVEFPRQGFELEDLKLIKASMATTQSYRAKVSVMTSEEDVKTVDAKWQAQLQVSSLKALKLIEDQ